MRALTATILVGPRTWDSLGVPTHALYLTENSVPMWTLVATGLHGRGPQAVERLAWVPTVKTMLDDGLLMLGLHVAGFPDLRALADRCFTADWRGEVELWRDIAPAHLQELHGLNRQQEWPENVAVTVMQDSTIGGQLGVLRHYRFRLDLCTWRLWRRQTQNGVSLRVGHDDPAEALVGEAP